MAVATGACRRLTDAGHTVLLAHHPSKHSDGSGGVRMRGHTSLWGEVDAVLEFTRPDRGEPAGVIRMEPKDSDLRIVRFKWNGETFRLQTHDGMTSLTITTIAATVRALYVDGPVPTEAIRNQFPAHGRTAFSERLSEAVDEGLIRRSGRGKRTAYSPADADDSILESWQ
jgi:hypothetical protein